MYFHSMIADYFHGIWGGGNPKPFKYTEIQKHRLVTHVGPTHMFYFQTRFS